MLEIVFSRLYFKRFMSQIRGKYFLGFLFWRVIVSPPTHCEGKQSQRNIDGYKPMYFFLSVERRKPFQYYTSDMTETASKPFNKPSFNLLSIRFIGEWSKFLAGFMDPNVSQNVIWWRALSDTKAQKICHMEKGAAIFCNPVNSVKLKRFFILTHTS